MMRLPGLASGMDTDSMVKQLMKAEQIKVDRVKQDKQILEWKKQLYNDINKDFANFILKVKKDFGYNSSTGRQGSIDWINKAVSSDEKIGTATAGSNAFMGNHKVEVISMAEGVSATSKAGLSQINKNGSDEKGLGYEGEFKINNEVIKISKTDTLTDIAKKINSSSAGVKASYDSTLDRLFLQTDKVGSESKIIFSGDTTGLSDGTDGLINDLGLVYEGGNKSGKDGEIKYNGLETTIKSNSFSFNGVNFTLNPSAKPGDVFNVNVTADVDGVIDKVKTFIEDYNNMLENIGTLMKQKVNRNYKPLTDEQREAMSEKEIELWETKAKSGIIRNDRDIQSMMSSMRLDLYKDVEGVTGSFKNITEIGITTQGYKSGSAGGKLQIDEEKLRKALEKDPEAVLEILFKEDKENAVADDSKLSASELESKRKNSGIVTRIFDDMVVGMKNLIAKSGTGDEGKLLREVRSNILIDFTINGGRYSKKGSVSDLEDEISKYNKRLDDLEKFLFRKENDYYAKFTAMEKAMQRMNSQSGWLSQQLGGN